MEQEYFRKVEPIFLEAVESRGNNRRAYLDRVCSENPELRNAFLDHLYAWEYMAKVGRARQQLDHDGFIEEALVRALLGVADSPRRGNLSELFRYRDQLDRLKLGASKLCVVRSGATKSAFRRHTREPQHEGDQYARS